MTWKWRKFEQPQLSHLYCPEVICAIERPQNLVGVNPAYCTGH